MNPLETILSRLGEIQEEMTALHAQDTLTEEDETRFTELSTEFDGLNVSRETIVERNDRLEAIRVAASDPRNVISGQDTTDPLGEPGSLDSVRTDDDLYDMDRLRSLSREAPETAIPELRGRAVDAIDRARGMSDSVKEQATRFAESLDYDEDDDDVTTGTVKVLRHLVATSSPEYQRQFGRYMRAGLKGRRNAEAEQFLNRAMSLTDAAGGFAVPLPVDPTLNITGDGSANPFRMISRVVPIVTDVLRTVSSADMAFSWDAEAAEVSDDATTFANIDITAHKASGFIPYSIESGQDIPNFTTLVGTLMAEGHSNLEATAMATGTGSGQPFGIVTAKTATALPSYAADTFDLGEVYKLPDTLGDRFDANASWVANKAIYSLIRQFDTAGGAGLWERLGAGVPSELLGYPVYKASGMDSSITGGAENYVLILGDFSNYWIANRIGFSVEAIPHLFATGNNRPSGQRGLYAYWRVGADSVNDSAFEMLNVT